MATLLRNQKQPGRSTVIFRSTMQGIYHISDGWLTEQNYHFERFDEAKRELIWAQAPGGKPGTWDDLYGLMRVNGSWLVEPQYSFAIELEHNRAPVRKKN